MDMDTSSDPHTLSSPKFWIVVGGAALLFFAIAAGSVFSGKTQQEREDEAALRSRAAAYEESVARFKAAMANDAWGGQTPEETLQLFITALEAGDVDLAAKYFMLETDETSPDYLTRRKWEEGLRKAKEEGRIGEMTAELKKVNLQPSDKNFPGYAVFESPENNRDEVVTFVNMQLNKFSNLWKIVGI
jgi:hypothetical protein